MIHTVNLAIDSEAGHGKLGETGTNHYQIADHDLGLEDGLPEDLVHVVGR